MKWDSFLTRGKKRLTVTYLSKHWLALWVWSGQLSNLNKSNHWRDHDMQNGISGYLHWFLVLYKYMLILVQLSWIWFGWNLQIKFKCSLIRTPEIAFTCKEGPNLLAARSLCCLLDPIPSRSSNSCSFAAIHLLCLTHALHISDMTSQGYDNVCH